MAFLCILFSLAAPDCWGQASKSAPAQKLEDSLIGEGLRAYQAGSLGDAISLLEQANVAAPENPYARLFLGLFLYEKDPRSLKAIHLMESVVDRFPSNQDLYLRLLDSTLVLGKKKEVPGLLTRMQKLMESNSRFALNIIYTLIRHGELEAAGRELDKVSERSVSAAQGGTPTDLQQGEILFIRGLIAASTGRKDEAMSKFKGADRFDFPPQNAPQMRMLAEALSRLEMYNLSAQAYQVYLKSFPKDAEARFQLGVAYGLSSAFNEAKEQLMQVAAQAPSMPQLNYYLGAILVELKRNDEAKSHFETEIRRDARSYQAMAQMGYLDYLRGDNEKCRQWLEKALALSQDWPDTYFFYGLLYNRLGKYDLAVQNLEKAVRLAPRHIKAHYQLSIAYLRDGNEEKAKEHEAIYDRLLAEHKAHSLGDSERRK